MSTLSERLRAPIELPELLRLFIESMEIIGGEVCFDYAIMYDIRDALTAGDRLTARADALEAALSHFAAIDLQRPDVPADFAWHVLNARALLKPKGAA